MLGMSYVAFFTGAYAAPVEPKRCCRKRYNVLKRIERKISKNKRKGIKKRGLSIPKLFQFSLLHRD